MLFSSSDKQLAFVAYVPKAKAGKISAKEWMAHVMAAFGGGALPYGDFVGEATQYQAVGVAKQNS